MGEQPAPAHEPVRHSEIEEPDTRTNTTGQASNAGGTKLRTQHDGDDLVRNLRARGKVRDTHGQREQAQSTEYRSDVATLGPRGGGTNPPAAV